MVIVGCEESNSVVSNSLDSFKAPSQEEMLNKINEVRNQKIDCNNGLGYVGPSQPLSWNNSLYNSSSQHSQDLAMSDTFSHYGSGTEYDITGYNLGRKSYFTERIRDNGYDEYKAIGENIAGGHTDFNQVIDSWLKSPKHCENLMRAEFDEVGLAIVVNPNSQYGIYWTQNFGQRKKKE